MNFLGSFLVLLIAIGLLLFFIRNNITYKQRIKIVEAIDRYSKNNKLSFEQMNDLYSHMEGYNKTLLRIRDWGYKNIVDKDTFELIKPYI